MGAQRGNPCTEGGIPAQRGNPCTEGVIERLTFGVSSLRGSVLILTHVGWLSKLNIDPKSV